MEDVEQTPKALTIVIRPDLKRACCEGDACRAAILNQLLYCIAWKLQQGKDYWYGSYDEIWKTLLDESWGKSKVIKEVNALVEQGYLEQRRNPTKGWDQTRQYLFGEEQAKKLREACEKAGICAHQIGFPPIVVHLLNLTNAFSKNKKCISCNQQMQSLDSTNPSVENNRAIPKNTTKTSSKNTTKITPDVSSDASKGQSGTNKNINNKIIDFPEGDHSHPQESNGNQGKRNGYIDIDLRPCCSDLEAIEQFEEHSQRVNAIYLQAKQSGCDLPTFRAKIKSLHRSIRDNPLPDGQVSKIEYFHERLCKAFGVSVEPIAMEG